MDGLLRSLSKMFSQRINDCRIIVDVTLGVQIDALLWVDNYFVVIELKKWGGEIIANATKEEKWKTYDKGGKEVELENNPYYQVMHANFALADFLLELILKDKRRQPAKDMAEVNAPATHEGEKDEIRRELLRRIRGWVVLDNDATVRNANIDLAANNWFKILKIRDVHEEVITLGGKETQFVNPRLFEEIVKFLNAKETTLSGWLSPDLKQEVRLRGRLRVPKIDEWLAADREEDVINALNFIVKLELVQDYHDEILSLVSSNNGSIRALALKIVMDWRFPERGVWLSDALTGPSARMRTIALDYLVQYSVPEAFDSLLALLASPKAEYNNDVLRALSKIGNRTACPKILQFLSQNLGSIASLEERMRATKSQWGEFVKARESSAEKQQDDAEGYELLKQLNLIEQELQNRNELFATTCQTVGSLGCGEAVSWLSKLILSPSEIGLTIDTEFPDTMSTYFHLFTSAVKALGSIGDKTVGDMLLGKLVSCPEEYKPYLIEALGDLGGNDSRYSEIIKRSLNSEDEQTRLVAIQALGKLGASEAFEDAVKIYQFDSRYQHLIEKSLQYIDRRKFEKFLITQLKSKDVSASDKERFLRSLSNIASIRSLRIVLTFLGDEALYLQSASIVAKFIRRNDPLSTKILELTKSVNEFERASALYLQHRYYGKRIALLEKFETDPSPHVRKAVLEIYMENNLTSKVTRFAKDEDRSIRSGVFHHFAGMGMYCGRFLFASDDPSYGMCELTVSPQSIVILLDNSVHIIMNEDLIRIAVIRYKGVNNGIYINFKDVERGKTCGLLSMSQNDIKTGLELIETIYTTIAGSKPFGGKYLTLRERNTIKELFMGFKSHTIPSESYDLIVEEIA